jgi:hypothetical protein
MKPTGWKGNQRKRYNTAIVSGRPDGQPLSWFRRPASTIMLAVGLDLA